MSVDRVTQGVCKSQINELQIWFKARVLDRRSSGNAYTHVIRKRALQWKPVPYLRWLFERLLGTICSSHTPAVPKLSRAPGCHLATGYKLTLEYTLVLFTASQS